jgi:hypothetical protein
MPNARETSAMPMSRNARRPTMSVSAPWASRTRLSRKRGVASLTASTPVIAVQPLANARISSQRLTAVAAVCVWAIPAACAWALVFVAAAAACATVQGNV